MQLQVDREALDSEDLSSSDVLFSPVLLWRPGRKQLTHQSNSNRRRVDVHDVQPSSSFPPHPHTPLLTPPTLSRTINGNRKRKDGGKDKRGEMTENVTRNKHQLPFKTTNLTDALPPQEGLESTVNENKVRTCDPLTGVRPNVQACRYYSGCCFILGVSMAHIHKYGHVLLYKRERERGRSELGS